MEGRPPQIYLTDGMHANAPLPLGESRYPALSADGRWMAYSHLGEWRMEFVGARSENWFDTQAGGCAVQSNPAFMGGGLEDPDLRQ